MGAAVEGHLRAGDRRTPKCLRRVRELERAVDAVVVGERERLVPELRRPRGELLRLRGPVQERVGAVGVQLDVAHPSVLHEHTFAYHPFASTWKVLSCDRRARFSSRLRNARLRDSGLLRAPRFSSRTSSSRPWASPATSRSAGVITKSQSSPPVGRTSSTARRSATACASSCSSTSSGSTSSSRSCAPKASPYSESPPTCRGASVSPM